MSGRRAAGTLEAEVLAALWEAEEPLTAQEVRHRLEHDLAHTTVNTILGRLHDKGAVERRTGGRGYEYWPLLDQAGLTARRMQALLDDAPDPASILSRFVDGLDCRTVGALRALLEGVAGGPPLARRRPRRVAVGAAGGERPGPTGPSSKVTP